jgi:DNA invertase Pin-like site-specific DNA recombinase
MATRARIAIYARVSTGDKGQDPGSQLLQLRRWCESMGYPVVGEYVEHESGAKAAGQRREYARLFADAARRKFDMVLVWALDRFSRAGMASTIADLQRLNSYGVAFHSYSEPHLSTDNELVRDVLLAVLSSLAKLERQKISERTRAGLERARANGKRLGRPQLSARKQEKLRMALDARQSWHAASLETRIPYSTVKKYARAFGYEPRQRKPGDGDEIRHG